jgi:hypothetical protein
LSIVFHSVKGDPVSLEVHAFQTSKFQGTAVETEEMRPQWFQEDQVAQPDWFQEGNIAHPDYFKKARGAS